MPQLTLLKAEQSPSFPPTSMALDEPEGLLAIGGQLTEDWLLHAYQRGIFPWFSHGDPIMWWSPAPRMVLTPGQAHISRSLKKHFRRQTALSVRANAAFERVIGFCADESLRQEGTWITSDMQSAYNALHRSGWAHSVEVYDHDRLIGGLYGIGIGSVFYGESMFSLSSNASKYAFIALSEWAAENDLSLIDCQLYNPYLASLGGELIGRDDFESYLPQQKKRLCLEYGQDLTTSLQRAMGQ